MAGFPLTGALRLLAMSIFGRPHYTSDTTQFIDQLKSSRPEIEQGQLEGRSLLWDKQVDRDLLAHRWTTEDLARGSFDLLNERRDLAGADGTIGWDPPEASHLWLFHLHYWEWAWSLAADADRERAEEMLYVGLSRATDRLVVVGDPDVTRAIGGDEVARRLGL